MLKYIIASYIYKKDIEYNLKLLNENAIELIENNNKLCVAAWSGNFEQVKYLLDNGANIHTNKDFSLYMAAYNGHVETVKLLLERSAYVYSDTYYEAHNNRPSYGAKISDYIEIMYLLAKEVQYGSPLNYGREDTKFKVLRINIKNKIRI